MPTSLNVPRRCLTALASLLLFGATAAPALAVDTTPTTTMPENLIACCADSTCIEVSESFCAELEGIPQGSATCFPPARGAVDCGTTGTTMTGPVCGNGVPEAGEDCDDGNTAPGDCCSASCKFEAPSSSCTDGLYCNGAETCDGAGSCIAGTPPFCDDGIDCTADSCDEGGDTCVNAPTDTLCGDGVSCTIDRCDQIDAVRRSGSSGCSHTPDDSACTDEDACTGTETCDVLNDCQAGTPVNCDDLADCTTDTCNPSNGACSNTPDHGFCDDKVSCTVDLCEVSGDRIPVSDGCTHTPDDGACDDGAYCNGAETCNTVTDCTAGTAVNCSDGIDCTDDACNETTDSCDNTPNDANCDDDVSCTVDSCSIAEPRGEGGSGCANAPDDALCDDAAFCNGTETCNAETDCAAGTPVDCTDGSECTNDTCDEDLDACDNTPDDALCDDGVFCNGAETCGGKGPSCLPGTPPDCEAGDACNTGTCNEETDACDLTPANDGDPCDDGQNCTTSAECLAGACTAIEQTTLAPSCRWIAVASETGEDVNVRTDLGSVLTGSICGDIGKRIRGDATGDVVATLSTDPAIRFDQNPTIGGNIVTGGGSLISGTADDIYIPNTDDEKTVAGGVNQAANDMSGNVLDTTGTHPLLTLCQDDQDLLDTAEVTLNAVAADATLPKLKVKGTGTIDTGGDDLYILHIQGNMKIAGRSTLEIVGDPEDIVVVIVDGSLQFAFGATVGPVSDTPDGFIEAPMDRPGPNNVLFYAKDRRCKLGRSTQGYGTFFCPEASKFRIGKSTRWLGTFLGGQRRGEMRFRPSVDLRRTEFIGNVPTP